MVLKYYAVCKDQVGGNARIEQMMKLIDYLYTRDWMKASSE